MSIDQYLRDAKQIADSLAVINCPVTNQDFIDHVLLGLSKEYDTLVGIITHFSGQLTIEELRTKLLLHEQRLQRFKELDSPVLPQAFSTHTVPHNMSGSLVLNLFPKVVVVMVVVVVDNDFPHLKVEDKAEKDVVLMVGVAKCSNYLRTTIQCVLAMDSLYQDKASGQTLLQAFSKGDVYPFSPWSKSSYSQASVAVRQPGDIWHPRLGHSVAQVLSSRRSKNVISLLNSFSNNCVSCRLGKSQHLPFNLVEHGNTSPLEIIHSDVWHSPVSSKLGFLYYVIFADDFSRFA
ncbi:hypothetical protein RND71_004269 [Anisodus tanguticus]|uniref:GAG-pre-integrase domain-containing protein n=1 Tax=Anisodus tanguticus TaxID=243964 RepID=A0AAE1SYD0_9SOLA|nr:hypothetical protein RND71_004269 [Anisodus tanguticus]